MYKNGNLKFIMFPRAWSRLFFIMISLLPVRGVQALEHPVIWATAGEKKAILENIKQYEWAADMKAQLRKKTDDIVKKHISDPEDFLSTLPPLGGSVKRHSDILDLSVFSAVLYYLSENDAYAQFSADVLHAYFLGLSEKDPQTTTIVGNQFEDGRWTFPNIAITYDLIHPFLKKRGTTVYDAKTKMRTPYNDELAQKVIRHIALYALQEWGKGDKHGRDISNHHLLTATGSLYPILCIEDKAERERLFDVFWNKGTREQASYRNTVLPMFNKHGQGILPESTSYGAMSPMEVLETIDRIKPELNAVTDNVNILEGRFIFPQLTNPGGIFIRYGDSKRYNGSPAGHLNHVRGIAYRQGLTPLQREVESYLKLYPGTYHPRITEFRSCLGLLRTPPPPFDPGSVKETAGFKRTVLVKHAGIALVRNYVNKENETYGLNGYIGGAHYVHSHCTGIAMELYGAGYVMAPNGGMPKAVADRAKPVHTNYRRLYAGNNTVIVNGSSHGTQNGAWKTKSNVWQNNAVNIASEPGHLEEAVSENFGFATQFLKDKVNDCRQQRTLGVIRTGPTSGYYLDIFRSRSEVENKFHDYIYHNIGDETLLTDDKLSPFILAPTDKYDNDIGDLVQSPGWRFFEDGQSTKPTADAARIMFKINKGSRFMHMAVPGGVPREYTRALGPPTPEAKNKYDRKKTQILAIRQYGEAWDRPFAVVFEPSLNETPTVASVTLLFSDGKWVGVEVRSEVNGITITDVIIENAKADASVILADRDIEFAGRFAVVRTERTGGNTERLSLYIGEGSHLRCGTHQLKGSRQNQGFKQFNRL